MTVIRWPLLLCCLLLASCSKETLVKQTPAGVLQGYLDDSIEHYLGIPYAQPPVGALRWRPPQPLPDWGGVLEATGLAASCPQFTPLVNSMSGDEDCLYLNVWVHKDKADTDKLPVMVWIHGGGFTAGQGAYVPAEGAGLARVQDVVVVSMNYRLGVFGFLSHPDLLSEDPAHPGAGNYGIQDQQAALQWVQDNIAAFGGDPDNVTVFGQSAGGVSVCAQLASPQSAGLFHRAIIQSGPCESRLSTTAGANQQGEKLARELACSGAEDILACMRNRSTEDVARILPPDPSFAFGEGYAQWWPLQDGYTLPENLQDAFVSGEFNQVPVMMGATADEGSLIIWMSHDMLFKPLNAGDYLERIEFLVGDEGLAKQAADQYPLDNYESPSAALTALFSDGFFNCMTRHTAQALQRHVPVWVYQFDFDQAPFFIPWADLGAFHAAEIQYIFQAPMSFTGGFKDEQAGLAQSMAAYWASFARHGNPNYSDGLPWPAYGDDDRHMVFNLQNKVGSQARKQRCEFWEQVDYIRAPYS